MTEPARLFTRGGRLTCQALTADGAPCGQVVAAEGTGLCLWHDPARADVANEARTRGLANAHIVKRENAAKRVKPFDPPPTLELTPDGLLHYAAWVVQAVATGHLDAKTGNALAYSLVGLRKGVNDEHMATALRAARAELAELKVRLRHQGDR